VTSPAADSRNWAKAIPFLIVVVVLLLVAFVGQRPTMRFFILGAGGLGLILLLRYPGLGLVALAGLSFTLPLQINTGTAVSLTPPVLLIPAVALAWLTNRLRKRSLQLPASQTNLPLILFVISGFLSLLAGNAYWDPLVPQPGNLLLVQLGQCAIFALSAIVFWLSGALGRETRWLGRATWVFLASAGVVVLESHLPLSWHVLGWSDPTMGSQSMLWTWLAALASGQLLFNRRLRPLLRLGLLALLLAAAYVVWFRLADWVSGWAPFTVAVVAVVWLWVWKRSRVAALLLGLVFVVLVVLLFPVLFEHAGGQRELDISWGGRVVLYRAVLDLVKDHPILGLGPAAYRHYGHTRWLSLGVGRALYLDPRISSHNNYIDIYAQMGLLGLGLFLWFLAEVGRLGWRLVPCFEGDFEEGYVYGALGGLAGTLVAMMLADWFLPFVYNIGFAGFRTSALAWMFLGGLVALASVSSHE